MTTKKVHDMIQKGKGEFVHGHTYEGRPTDVAGALEVQKIIQEDNLLDNVTKQGNLLVTLLKKELSDHPNVGDIRGKGLFIAIEIVEIKITKRPFDPKLNVAKKISDLAFSPKFNMTVYHGSGTVDGIRGDHIMLCPPYIITEKHVVHIVNVVSKAVKIVCSQITSEKN
jgi:adenosylmethionine-8-amino-7-oxononanoate aminotransferase